MDIGGTKKRVQRLMKVAEQSYKKMNELMERIQHLQDDVETTSAQVDHIEYELAEQRALLESLAEQQGLDVEEVLASAELPEPPQEDDEEAEETEEAAQKATSRPSANDDSE
jgi:GAF domain-containing protein